MSLLFWSPFSLSKIRLGFYTGLGSTRAQSLAVVGQVISLYWAKLSHIRLARYRGFGPSQLHDWPTRVFARFVKARLQIHRRPCILALRLVFASWDGPIRLSCVQVLAFDGEAYFPSYFCLSSIESSTASLSASACGMSTAFTWYYYLILRPPNPNSERLSASTGAFRILEPSSHVARRGLARGGPAFPRTPRPNFKRRRQSSNQHLASGPQGFTASLFLTPPQLQVK